jgi:hypothetical protein
MNERADNINGLVEHQMMMRFSPKLAERVHKEYLGAAPGAARPRFDIVWVEDRVAEVTFGNKVYPGLLLDLPTVNETYKMASKSRLYKSGDVGQVLLVHDPDDAEERLFNESQRYDHETHTLLSGFAPPTTYIWSRIFKRQNRPPKVDFHKIEQDLGDVNILLKEDVEMEFIHPRELETLYLKPGQILRVDGTDVEATEGKSVGEIIKIKRMEAAEQLKQRKAEEKRLRKEAKRRKKMDAEMDPAEKKARIDRLEARLQEIRFRPNTPPSEISALEKELEELNGK